MTTEYYRMWTSPLIIVWYIVWAIVILIPAWRIVSKAGYSGAWSLLMLIPVVNLVALYVFAFSNWPLERRAPGS